MDVSFIAPTLQQPVAITDDYMLLPVETSFNWEECFQAMENGEWYLVVFRSKHRLDADEALLTELDNGASAAARETPGFLHYFIGTPRATGECLSFCLWEDQASARAGSAKPAHHKAIQVGMQSFEYYTLERHVITKTVHQLSFLRLS
jgi:heme-degrading monooxygenase HmoA